jgi:enoyl-CoA hydratase
MGKFIRTETLDHVLVITLDRQESRNAFNRAMADEMEAIIDDYEANTTLRAAVIQAAGPTFSAGQDLKEAAVGGIAVSARRGPFGIMAKPPTKPLIAAVEGEALAGGMELTLCCDLIVASTKSVFGLAEARRGLVALGGGCFRAPHRIPYNVAMEMILVADPIPAAEMHRVGYVNRLVEPGQALETALGLARKIAGNGPLAVLASKEIAVRSYAEQWPDQDCWAKQMDIVAPVLKSEDLKEGLRAFAEKRPAVWKGI